MSSSPTPPPVGSAAPKAATMENSQPSYHSPTAASSAKKKALTLKEQRALYASKAKLSESVRTVKVPVPATAPKPAPKRLDRPVQAPTTSKPKPAVTASKRSTKPTTMTTKAPARKTLVKNAPKPMMTENVRPSSSSKPAVKEKFHPFFDNVIERPIPPPQPYSTKPASSDPAAPVIKKSLTLKEQAAVYTEKGKVTANLVRVVKITVKADDDDGAKSRTSTQPSSKKGFPPTQPPPLVKNAPKPAMKKNAQPSSSQSAAKKSFHPFFSIVVYKPLPQPQPQPYSKPASSDPAAPVIKKSLTLKQQMAAYAAKGKVRKMAEVELSKSESDSELEKKKLKETHPALMTKDQKAAARRIAAEKMKMAAARRAEAVKAKASKKNSPGPALVANIEMEIAEGVPVAEMAIFTGPVPGPVADMEVVAGPGSVTPVADMSMPETAEQTTPSSGKKRSRDYNEEDDVENCQEEEGSPRGNKRAQHC